MKKYKDIRLVPVSKKHVDYIMTWINDPEVKFYFGSMKKKYTEEDEIKYVRKMQRSKTDKVFSVFDGNEYIGQTSINFIHWQSGEGRMFLVVVRKHWNQGYAHRIVKAIQDIAFKELGLYRLYLIIRPGNKKGRQLYGKCGFSQEGYYEGQVLA